MATKSQDFTIGGITFNITQYNAREGISIKIKLGQYLSPIAKILKNNIGSDKSILDSEINLEEIIEGLISKMDDIGTVNFIMRMVKHVRINGVEMSDDLFDQTFAANYIPLYKLLIKIVEYNRFFGKGSITEIFKKAQILPAKESH